MGYIGQNANATIDEIKAVLKHQFKKTKSYSQTVNELKDIKKWSNEPVWEVDQQLKKVIRDGGFQYDDR